MPYDEGLAQRIRELLDGAANISEKRMFGGLAFFANDGMAAGIIRDELMVRVGPRVYGDALARPFARAMDFTGRRMRGFVQVAPEGFEVDGDLQFWIGLGIEYAIEVQEGVKGAAEPVSERVVGEGPLKPKSAKRRRAKRPTAKASTATPKAAASKPPRASKKSSTRKTKASKASKPSKPTKQSKAKSRSARASRRTSTRRPR